MISKKTAAEIWRCWNEIEKAEKLLEVMKKNIAEGKEPTELKDYFGQEAGLKLAVPSGPASHSLYGVSPELALKIIEMHITDGHAKLERLKVNCLIELK